MGSRYATNGSLPGTDSQRAANLLDARFPAQAGDLDHIVLYARHGRITDPDVRGPAEAMLARVARLPHVVWVISPYQPAGAREVAPGGRIAFASVGFDSKANELRHATVLRVVDTARRASSPALQVALGGQAIELAQGHGPLSSEAVGLGAAIVILLISFGSLLAMGLPVVTALFGLGTGLGLVTVITHVFTTPDFAPELAAMVGLGVGIDYALFLLTRFREDFAVHGDTTEAVASAMGTAGRAVLFAGTTVVIALMGMFVMGLNFMHGMATAASLAVALTMAASLTLLPALLSWVGPRLGRRRTGRRLRRHRATDPLAASLRDVHGGFWERWGRLIQRRPWPAALAGLALMAAFCVPALSMRSGSSDAGNDRPSDTTRQAYDLLARGFGPGFNGPLQIVVKLPHRGDAAPLAPISAAVARDADVAVVTPAKIAPAGDTATFSVYPRSAPQAAATTDLVNRLRDHVIPPVEDRTNSTVYVGGVTAAFVDFSHVLAGKLPLFIGIVVALSALLLLVLFRSLVIPIQAAVMNLLSIGAALGVVVAIFQWGWLGDLLGVKPGPIEAFLPVMVFAIVFGLSMDYEVFLVSRIREDWVRRGNTSRAVVAGLATTGRVVTAAAAIMVCVFGSFVLGGDRVIKLFGLALAGAVFLDAVVIRCLLLPAVLELLGPVTWRLPGWLDRRLPALDLAGEGPPLPLGEPVPPAPAEPAQPPGVVAGVRRA